MEKANAPSQFSKDQENPNFWAFETRGSLTNNPLFEPGRLGTRSDGTKIVERKVEVEENSLSE